MDDNQVTPHLLEKNLRTLLEHDSYMIFFSLLTTLLLKEYFPTSNQKPFLLCNICPSCCQTNSIITDNIIIFIAEIYRTNLKTSLSAHLLIQFTIGWRMIPRTYAVQYTQSHAWKFQSITNSNPTKSKEASI